MVYVWVIYPTLFINGVESPLQLADDTMLVGAAEGQD